MLNVTNLGFDYSDIPILQNVQFNVPSGHLLHIRGQNGAGKTTLLKLLAGLLQPALGDIQYNGQSIRNNRSAYQQTLRYVGHKTGVSLLLTVRESTQYDVFSPSAQSFEALIQRFGLMGLEDVPCGLLSQGLRRRVGLLRLLIAPSTLWLLDEPLVALDQDAISILMDCFREHLDQGGLIVLTSHQPLPLKDRPCLEYCL